MTNQHFSLKGELPGDRAHWAILAGLATVTLIGLYLRLRCLGCLGFRWDEDLTSLAVKALLEKGVPELPSGMIYLRFYPLQLITSWSVEIFGFSEFSMRLPSVFFGTLLIPATYWVTTKFCDRRVALIAASCIAVSFWQVEMSRTARMYAPFFLTYLIAAYTIYRYHFLDRERLFSIWVLPMALLALTMHQLAYSLALLLLLAIPLNRSLERVLSLTAQAAAIGIAFVTVNITQQHYFNIPRALTGAVTSMLPGESPSGALSALLAQVSLPDLTLLSQVANAYAIPFSLALIAIAVLATPILKRVVKLSRSYTALTVFAFGLAVAHQFNLAVIVLASMLICLKSGIAGVRKPEWYLPAFLCVVVLAFWLVIITTMIVWNSPQVALAEEGPRKLVRALIDYPNFRLFWSYVLERPFIALPLALGTLWAIDRIARDRPDPASLFLAGGFWLVLFVNGILTTKFEFFRYNLHLDPIYLMLVLSGILALPLVLSNVGLHPNSFLNDTPWRRNGPLVAAAITIIGMNPLAAALTSQRGYVESGSLYSLAGLDEYADFKTPAQYVREHLHGDDLVLVLDPREYWNYIGHVDYWIRTSNYQSQTYRDSDGARDLYLGIPLIHNVEDLTEIIANHPGPNVWIVFSRRHLNDTPWVSPEIKVYLGNLEPHVAYTGRDEDTIVIRISR